MTQASVLALRRSTASKPDHLSHSCHCYLPHTLIFETNTAPSHSSIDLLKVCAAKPQQTSQRPTRLGFHRDIATTGKYICHLSPFKMSAFHYHRHCNNSKAVLFPIDSTALNSLLLFSSPQLSCFLAKIASSNVQREVPLPLRLSHQRLPLLQQ